MSHFGAKQWAPMADLRATNVFRKVNSLQFNDARVSKTSSAVQFDRHTQQCALASRSKSATPWQCIAAGARKQFAAFERRLSSAVYRSPLTLPAERKKSPRNRRSKTTPCSQVARPHDNVPVSATGRANYIGEVYTRVASVTGRRGSETFSK